ncbi:MAG: TetR/AcrR family transcriptional regulator [Bradyrhizobiaceae bacterium]|nr:MAG: TetR/AcrR family transcriptional regulator [Bradyrhizobiaceae bacterium]
MRSQTNLPSRSGTLKSGTRNPTPGRPRDPKVHAEILKAASAILLEEGFRALTMERLAARAGVGKTSVYRRWSSLSDLVTDLLEEANNAWPMPQKQCDTIEEDLRTLYRNWITGMYGAGKIIPVLIAESVQNQELAKLLHEKFFLPRRHLAMARIERAKQRKEVPASVDARTVVDLLMGRMWYRYLITGDKVRLEDEDKVVSILLKGVTP